MNRFAPAARPLLASLAFLTALLAFADGIPPTGQVVTPLSRALFGDAFYGPALSDYLLVLLLLWATITTLGISLLATFDTHPEQPEPLKAPARDGAAI
ncbi:hypothetical protein ACIA8F_31875 [Streptomyces sp. NPDC051563]|uniref:hypothetical protein n=1 Tax=Streptomyces sp. NPDC051563 TaxID=3365659 RepID=UPI0037BDDAF7